MTGTIGWKNKFVWNVKTSGWLSGFKDKDKNKFCGSVENGQ